MSSPKNTRSLLSTTSSTRAQRSHQRSGQQIDQSHRVSERGSTTLIAILVLFALMGLGLLSMRHTYQDMSSAGNLRRSTQARFIAEMGVHHALTLLQQQGSYLLGQRQPGDILELNNLGQFSYISRNPAGVERLRRQLETGIFPALVEGPSPVGQRLTQRPSYRVRIEGITDGPPPPGQELSLSDLGTPRQSYCVVQVSSRGYLSRLELPEDEREDLTDAEWRAAAVDVAEHRVKAALTLGPFMIPGCAL